MDKKSIVLITSLFVLIIAGMFGYSYLKEKEISEMPPEKVVVEEEESAYSYIDRITAKHYFIEGEHTYVGEIEMPTPCDLLEVEALVMESFPEQIRLDFSVINNSDTCAQVMTAQRFMVSATASSEATTSATFMGKNVELNLVPAAEGETPEEFELFIKG